MSASTIEIVGIPGSLREYSFNRALIKAAIDAAPKEVNITLKLLHNIPLYNADVEAQGDPEAVRDLKAAIRNADGVLFSTPQYNGSMSGVLKNAIDWASRPAFESVLADKPVAVIGATVGRSATEKARADLVRVLGSTRSSVMATPTIGLSTSGDYIDSGVVQSAEVRDQLREVLEDFGVFIRGHVLADAAD